MTGKLSDHFSAYVPSGHKANANYRYLLEQLERLERNHARLLDYMSDMPFCFTEVITDWEDDEDE